MRQGLEMTPGEMTHRDYPVPALRACSISREGKNQKSEASQKQMQEDLEEKGTLKSI